MRRLAPVFCLVRNRCVQVDRRRQNVGVGEAGLQLDRENTA